MRSAGNIVLLVCLAWLAPACSGPAAPPKGRAPATVPDTAAQPDPCGTREVQLAHCPGAVRNFRTALVAVHGWNGSCASTFGQQKTSLYQILGKRKFYDWDCFQYDSLHFSIDRNVEALRGQLRLLRRDHKYEKVLLATHSTGGVLALDLLTREYATQDGPRGDLPQIAAVLAWATPINGLRQGISVSGKVLSIAHFSPETLPDLTPGSRYLTGLKARLGESNRRYSAATGPAKGKLEFRVWFLQGQGKDMVVRSIVPDAAAQEGWYVKDRDELINTGEGHTHNVGQAGTEPIPRYPAKLLNYSALLNLQVVPRYDEVFPPTLCGGSVPAALESRQEEVVDGLTYFADQNFPGAFTPSLDFLRGMYQRSFTRSRPVDQKLVRGFLDLLEKKAGKPDEHLVQFLVGFANRVLLGYDPSTGNDVCLVGHGEYDVAKAILKTADILRREVVGFLRAHPESAYLVAPDDVDTFDARLVELLSKFQGSPHGPVQYAALSTLATVLPGLSDQVVAKSGAVPRFNDYYLANVSGLSADALVPVKSLYTNLAQRGPEIRTAAYEALTAERMYRGSMQPAWVALADNAAVRALLEAIDPQTEDAKREKLRFAAEVAARAGASGNDKQAARAAIDVGKEIVGNTKDRALRRDLERELKEGVERSRYPDIEQSYEPPF